jgi:hypothetical protein
MSDGIWDIVDRHGWNDKTLVELTGQFLATTCQEKEFEKFLARIAAEENEE